MFLGGLSVCLATLKLTLTLTKTPTLTGGNFPQEAIVRIPNRILMGEDDLPEWMTDGRTVLCQKDPQKGNTGDNY